jgi:hypothetical protein
VRLSEYMERLRVLSVEVAPLDPEVAITRYSDLTTDLQEGYPCVVRILPPNRGSWQSWRSREHSSMSEEQKAQLETVIELAAGN